MTPEEKREIQEMIDAALRSDFSTKKLGDTPTDARQLTPKVYVDTETSSVYSAITTQVNSVYSAIVPTDNNSSIFTFAEAISSFAAVVMGRTINSVTGISSAAGITRNLTSDAIPGGSNLWGQTVPANLAYLRQVRTGLSVGGSGSWTFQLAIEETSGGFPNNSVIATVSSAFTAGAPTSWDQTFTINPALKWSPGTTYAFVMNADNTTNTPAWQYSNGNTGPGQQVKKTGGVWSSTAGGNDDFDYAMFETATVNGSVFAANASLNDSRANDFLGITPSGGPSGGTGKVVFGGMVGGLSTNLTPGATYFISDTDGVISSLAGTQSRKIGMGVTPSVLLIKQDNA